MKSCRICVHPERGLIDKLLAAGVGPRSISRRIGGTSRVSLSRHKECLAEQIATEEKEEA